MSPALRPRRLLRPFLFALVAGSLLLPAVGAWSRHAAAVEAEAAAVAQAPAPGPAGELVASPEEPAPAAAPRQVFRPHQTTWTDRARSALGIPVLLGLCLLLSRNRALVSWRLVGIGMSLQLVFALFVLDSAAGRELFRGANQAIVSLLDYGNEGARFLFASHVTGQVESSLRNFAFGVLPSIVFFSALMAVLYHLGLMQLVIRGFSWVMQRTMRTSGAETLSSAANIFVGQTEAPLLVRPFVGSMTKSELLAVMAGGMANTAGGVLAAYVAMLHGFFPDIAGHLLAQSMMSAPAALVTAKILWPEDGQPVTLGQGRIDIPRVDANVLEAAARGASEGLTLAFNVAAMLIAFIALIALLDGSLAGLTTWLGLPALTFQKLAGWVFFPFAWVMGVPLEDCAYVGELLGKKTVLNEFVAYGSLATGLSEGTAHISERAMLIASYALAGFANFGSIAILIGGIGAMAPERRGDVASLGLYALVGGSIATFLTACLAGALG